MRTTRRVSCVALIMPLLLAAFSFASEPAYAQPAYAQSAYAQSAYAQSAYAQPASGQSGGSPAFASFRDIPGISRREVEAIEDLQKRTDSFVYGMLETPEAFYGDSGEIEGFSALMCEWLTGMFGIPFRPAIYEWGDLLAGLKSGEIDFSGELMATDERQLTYFMTDPIAERPLKLYRIAGSAPIAEIEASRPVRYAFLDGSTTIGIVASRMAGRFEPVLADSIGAAYGLLESGEADAFVSEGASGEGFSGDGGIDVQSFYPLAYAPVSMSTQNPALAHIIAVVQRALENGSAAHLAELAAAGQRGYKKHMLSSSLTDEERGFIQNNPVVRFAAKYDNYPVSFYNEKEGQWQGLAFDLLHEVEALTGISFELANGERAEWPELLGMLEGGEAAMLVDLIWEPGMEGKFVLSKTPIMSDDFALLSETGRRSASIDEIPQARVGLVKGTIYADVFRDWFPSHKGSAEYESFDDALGAMARGEIDMVMASERRILYLTHYLDRSGYKVNVLFDQTYDSAFGCGAGAEALCSIIDKSMEYVDMNRISGKWLYRTYDYQAKLAEAQRPWLAGAAALFLCVLILLYAMLRRKRHEGKRLEALVQNRTLELESNQARLEAIVSNYKGIMWSVDKDGAITAFNGQYLENIGVTQSFLVGKNINNAKQKNRHLDIIDNVEQTLKGDAQDWIGEIDGVVFRSCTTPIHGGDGQITGAVGSTDDISEIVKLHRDLEAALKEAENASSAKSAFLANMSHEIRTPMNAILGITEILQQQDDLPKETMEAVDAIYSSCDMLLGIINDILDLSKIEASKLELAPIRYDVASLINDTMHLNMMRFENKPIAFLLEVDESVPSALFGDELRIKQILNNLLSNAAKYTRSGEVVLSVTTERASSPAGTAQGAVLGTAQGATQGAALGTTQGVTQGATQGTTQGATQGAARITTLILQVRDTGLGMTHEQVGKLFDRYSRFNTEANRTTEGAGLGMGITRDLVELMSGKISVASRPGEGSVFTVRLPQGDVGAAILGRDVAENLRQYRKSSVPKSKKAQFAREPMPYGSVLVVDDLETNIYVARGLMKPYGLRVDSAMSGNEAIEKIKAGEVYDIVFMDHMMPNMDGMEATRLIREMGYGHPIVALTANAIAGQAELFLANGFDEFIAKPIDVRQLDFVLNKLVRDRKPPWVVAAARRPSAAGAAKNAS